MVCPSCSNELPGEFPFCPFCGAPLALPAPERRKLATLLFCDMSGSTALGERVDAESVRELMFQYFHEMRGAIERHGGTVEKFVGDAVMAVFGVPVTREDDALRAVRAASEMRDRLRDLNEEFESRFGTRIALRIGLNTGGVVAGDASSRESIVTGDSVNVAARLEHAAAPGDILLGEETHRLVRDAVEVEAIEPIAAKGKAEPVRAYRLLSVTPGPAAPGRPAAPLVGRAIELAALEALFGDAAAERRCLRVTIVGEPGVGKSRLAAEFVSRLGPTATVLRGRCLSYGEGITYWPLAEIVRQAARIRDEDEPEQARARIRAILHEPGAEQIAAAIGLGGDATSPEEIGVAFRMLFEQLAEERPLVAVIEDLHWAEATLLELLEGLTQRAHAPLLLLCTARPELAEKSQDWPGALRLEPLAEDELKRLLEPYALAEPLQTRVVASARGNPLFAEELAAYLREHPDTSAIPATLTALLTARLDLLPEPERSAAECGSVEGEVFHRGAVATLSGHEVSAELDRLVRREVLRPAEARFVDDAAFRFKHILVREAAYNGTTKRLRAELHERFANWLQEAAGPRLTEFEEILGYHLEQAFQYRAELGPVGAEARALAAFAAERLGSAGRRALARGDTGAASTLLQRTVSLLAEDDPRRLEFSLDLSDALYDAGEFERAKAHLAEVINRAGIAGDGRLEAHARIRRSLIMVNLATSTGEEARREAERAILVFTEAGDDLGLVRAWDLVANLHMLDSQFRAMTEAAERGLECARQAGASREADQVLGLLATAIYCSPLPVTEGIKRLEGIRDLAAGHRFADASVLIKLAGLKAMLGDFDEARTLAIAAKTTAEDLGQQFYAAATAIWAGTIELLAGAPSQAEDVFRSAFEELDRMGEKGVLCTLAAYLAEALYRQERYDEAARYSAVSEEAALADDLMAQYQWRAVRAKILARQGMVAEAEQIGLEAVTIARKSDYINEQADVLMSLSEVLQVARKSEEAVTVTEEALRLYERKGNVVSARRARELLVELTAA